LQGGASGRGRLRRLGTKSSQTLRWRGVDSNFRFRFPTAPPETHLLDGDNRHLCSGGGSWHADGTLGCGCLRCRGPVCIGALSALGGVIGRLLPRVFPPPPKASQLTVPHTGEERITIAPRTLALAAPATGSGDAGRVCTHPVLRIRNRTYCRKAPKAFLSGKCRIKWMLPNLNSA